MTRLRRHGFALVAALWLLILIAGVAAALQGVSVGVRRAAINGQLSARARWAARGAISRELARLDVVLSRSGVMQAQGAESAMHQLLKPATYNINGSLAKVAITDPASRVNVNTAGAQQLLALFEAVGIDNAAARHITSEILELRRAAGVRESHVAYPVDIKDSSRSRTFADPGEISLLRSIDAATYRRIAQFLTVYGEGRVNVNLAPPAVLGTVPGLDRKSIGKIVVRRAQSPFRSAFEIASLLPADSRARLQAEFGEFENAVSFTPRELLMEARVAGLNGKVVALVRLDGGATWSVESMLER